MALFLYKKVWVSYSDLSSFLVGRSLGVDRSRTVRSHLYDITSLELYQYTNPPRLVCDDGTKKKMLNVFLIRAVSLILGQILRPVRMFGPGFGQRI